MFERLMNLDVELRCLGTKAFVAKEQFVNDVFYSGKSKKNSSEDEDKKKETKAEMSDLLDQIQKAKVEGKDTSKLEKELKEKMDEFLAPEKKEEEEKPVSKEDISDIMDQIQKDKAEGKDTSELEKELKDKMEKFLSVPKTKPTTNNTNGSAVRRVERPTNGGGNAVRKVERPTNGGGNAVRKVGSMPEVTVGEGVEMDYSGQIQPGVTYNTPSEPSVNPLVDALNGASSTQPETK